jgi:hypothetical protein
MKIWLREFRCAPEPTADVSGFTCIWPLWNGQRAVSKKWPADRLFLFHKQRVRFFGMCEQSPVPDGRSERLDLILHHHPPGRKIYGIQNMFFREQSRRGREFIARCLLGKPTDLVCWRWESEAWPGHWEQIRRQPLRATLKCLTIEPLRTLRSQWKAERRFFLAAIINGNIYRMWTCLTCWRIQRHRRKKDGT